MQKQEEQASDTNTADISNKEKINPLVKGGMTIPASADSVKDYGNRLAKSSNLEIEIEKKAAEASKLNP